MTSDPETHLLSADDHARLARVVMRRQAALSVRVAAVFLTMLLGLPLINAFVPELANTPVLGFTATWLGLGVLSFPMTVLLSLYFVRASDRIESACTNWRELLDSSRDNKEELS